MRTPVPSGHDPVPRINGAGGMAKAASPTSCASSNSVHRAHMALGPSNGNCHAVGNAALISRLWQSRRRPGRSPRSDLHSGRHAHGPAKMLVPTAGRGPTSDSDCVELIEANGNRKNRTITGHLRRTTVPFYVLSTTIVDHGHRAQLTLSNAVKAGHGAAISPSAAQDGSHDRPPGPTWVYRPRQQRGSRGSNNHPAEVTRTPSKVGLQW